MNYEHYANGLNSVNTTIRLTVHSFPQQDVFPTNFPTGRFCFPLKSCQILGHYRIFRTK